jgi:hypothetical protein
VYGPLSPGETPTAVNKYIIYIHQTAGHHIPKDGNIYDQRREILKSPILQRFRLPNCAFVALKYERVKGRTCFEGKGIKRDVLKTWTRWRSYWHYIPKHLLYLSIVFASISRIHVPPKRRCQATNLLGIKTRKLIISTIHIVKCRKPALTLSCTSQKLTWRHAVQYRFLTKGGKHPWPKLQKWTQL